MNKKFYSVFVVLILIVLTFPALIISFVGSEPFLRLMLLDSATAENIDSERFQYESGLTASPTSPIGASHVDSPAPQSLGEGSESVKSAAAVCKIKRREFFSHACGSQMPYYVFVPEGSPDTERYPVLYLLHGAFDGYTAWKDHAEKQICDLVSEYRIMIVTPEGGSFGWYADSRFLKNNQIESYFIKELIPDVDSNFPSNGLRSIAGLSMGGHGAFVLCLRNPGVFISVSSMSGILDITSHPKQWRLPEVFGPYVEDNKADWENHSALQLIERSAGKLDSLPMLITVSNGDLYSIEENRLVHRQLEKMKVKHLYYESPGVHDWTYWNSQLPLHVSFHACWLNSGCSAYLQK